MTAAGRDASAQIDCNDQVHTLAVENGRLVAVDHPNPDRERALMGLGGPRIPCIGFVDAWEKHREDLDVLVLASRGPGDELPQPDGAALGGSRSGWVGSGPRPGRARWGGSPPTAGIRGWSSFSNLNRRPAAMLFGARPPEDISSRSGAEQLLGLGGGLPQALVESVITTWWRRLAERPDDPDVVAARPRLRAATYGRARLALRGWSGRWDIDVLVDEPGTPGSVSRDGGRLVVTVPLTWLPDVWLPGLATVAGLFCLSARADGPGHWRIHGLDRKFETLTVGISVRATD